MNRAAESPSPACCRDIGSTIDSIRLAPERREELVPFLAEQGSIYRGLGAKEAERLRGYILASFETVGLPDAAIPFVTEELQTGLNPYTVAAAAKALRGAGTAPEHIVALLPQAARRIASDDDYVQYECLGHGGADARTTALAEIFRTIALLGPAAGGLQEELDEFANRASAFAPDVRAALELARSSLPAAAPRSCCSHAPAFLRAAPIAKPIALNDLPLQDQHGMRFTYGDFLPGRPSVVTFFYTRCMNPEKCSLTITRLARLQRLLGESGLGSEINLAAFTYDPAYDHPERLHAYGIERGLRYDTRTKLIRTQDQFEPLQTKFDLGVGFGPSTVNRHSVELLILDSAGAVTHEFRRVQWDEAEVFSALQDEAAPRIDTICRSPLTP